MSIDNSQPQGASPPSSDASAAPGALAQRVIDRRRLRDYYEQRLDKEFDRLAALRLSTRRRKLALVWVGSALLLASGGALMAAYAGYQPLRSWAAYEVAAAAVAIGVMLIALLLKPIEDVPPPEQIENEIKAAREHDLGAHLDGALKLLTPSPAAASFDHRLLGYPDKQWCEDHKVPIHARIGFAKEPRFTPAKVTALKLLDERVAIYEGTVDLITGDLLSERLVEVRYGDIISLERSSVAAPALQGDGPRGFGKVMRAARQPPRRDKDTLTIHCAGSQPVRIVLRDAGFAEGLRGVRLPLSEPHEAVEAFWSSLRARWIVARPS